MNSYLFVCCPVCSFQFIHPYVEEGQVFDDYSWTKDYTDNYERYAKPVIESLKRKVDEVEAIIGRRPKSFLDVGCGNGIYLSAADVLGMRNLGTDVDRVNIEFAKGKGLNAVAAAIEDMELAERFDFIHLKAVLHLVPDPPRLLEKVKSLLAPDGVVYIDVPNQGSPFSKLRILRDRTSYGQLQLPHRRGAYNIKSMKFLCGKCGLKIAKRVFAYPGDRVYYPILGMNQSYEMVFKLFSLFGISSMLGIYLIEDKESSIAA